MKHFGKRTLTFWLLVVLLLPVNAQVMWNLKGGWMNREVQISEHGYKDYIEKKNKPDWMAGLELEIPLNEKLDLQTGLRYKNHNVLFFNMYDYKYHTEEGCDEAKTIFELPLRLTYKQQLGRHFSLHAGIGPYVSVIADGWESKPWRETEWSDFVHVGLEPSVAINWACFSLGATYNMPCFYKGYKDENKPVVMATLGIRFRSNVWKYVGAVLLSIATVGTAAAAVWPTGNNSDSYSSYGSYSGSSFSNSSSFSSSAGKKCKYCAGTGECRSLTDRYHCRGTGECKYCYGQGYQTTNGHAHECGVCRGSKKCHFCGGSGKCKHCGGTGNR